jgi:NAD(P)H-hydrate epimerase
VKVCRVSEIRDLDIRSMNEFSLSEELLMENAGIAVCQVISLELGIKDRKFVVFCGPGNNGGDGFVVARTLHSNQGKVKVFLLSKRTKYRGSPRTNLERLEKTETDISELGSVDEAKESIEGADAIVDGIFGTGLVRNVEGLYKETIELINNSKKKVFSIDIPTGINGDTGQEMGISVKADSTVTFGLPKIGNMLYPGYGRSGKLFLSHISYPVALQTQESIKVELSSGVKLPERKPNTSKFDYGPILVIAGASSYHWAPFASAYSFLKSGGGYVYLACPVSLVSSIAQGGREIVFLPQKETDSQTISYENRAELLESSKKMKMVVMGPGLSLNQDSQRLARNLAKEIDKPLLIDGDGITAIAKNPKILAKRNGKTVLTPHAGEMARITKLERDYIEKNRVDALQETTKRLNSIIVLKGPHTLIGYPDGAVYINLSGDTGGRAGMAKAGSGDVLNGTIAAMHGMGLSLENSVRTGVFIHGYAGDLASQEKGPDGMTANDILDFLPSAVQKFRESFEQISENYYTKLQVI